MEKIIMESQSFDLEGYSWKLLQKAYECYEQTGDIGEDISRWLKAQEASV